MIPNEHDLVPEETESYRPGPITILLTLLLVLAMLTTLIWPLLYTRSGRPPTPTPTPTFLREASLPQEAITRIAAQNCQAIKRALHIEGPNQEQGVSFLNFVGGGFSPEPSAQPNFNVNAVGPALITNIIPQTELKTKVRRV